VFPYLVLVASQLAQPFLINTILEYVGSSYDGTEEQKNVGYGLIGAYGFVYICIAVSTGTPVFELFIKNILGCNGLGSALVVSICCHVAWCSRHHYLQTDNVG
jgi:hypothetical protein